MRSQLTAGVLAVLVGTVVSGCGTGAGSPVPAPAPAAPAAGGPVAPGAAPVNVVGLVGGTSLVNFSTADRAAQDNRAVTGLAGDTRLVGIDYRVQDGKLYGVGDAGGVYTLDEAGAATKVKQLSVALEGTNFGVDFNPAANALRVISDTGQNLRQPFADAAAPTANDKPLTNPATPPATDPTPARGATSAGYTNNDQDNTTATALFVLDTTADRVSIQSPANAGTFAPMGGLGVDAGPAAGFDIHGPTAGAPGEPMALATLQVGGSYGLYRIDLLTGKAESMGALTEQVTDIAVPLGQA
jgi:hypothetical protein